MKDTTLNGIDAAFNQAYGKAVAALDEMNTRNNATPTRGAEDGNLIEEPQSPYGASKASEPAWSIHETYMD